MKNIKSGQHKESYMSEIDIKEIINTKRAWVYLRDILVGELEKCDEASIVFKFIYFKEYLESKNPAIARAFPKREESYISSNLHPFFDNLISEGWLLTYTEKTLHISKLDRFALLMATGSATIYGGSISGHQKKGMFKINSRTGELISTPDKATHILKPSGFLPELPENEHVTMAIAKALKLPTPPFDLLEFESIGRVFAIARFDRSLDKIALPLMQEDMCQVLGVSSDRKYDLSYEKVATAIRKHSSAPQIDLYDFYRRFVFCYLVLNGDMHLKNWSLLENQKDLGSFVLAPCYDLLNTRLSLPKEKSDIALQLNGKDRNLTKKDFSYFGKYIGLSNENIEFIFGKLPDWLGVIKKYVNLSLLSNPSKEIYLEGVYKRYNVLLKK